MNFIIQNKIVMDNQEALYNTIKQAAEQDTEMDDGLSEDVWLRVTARLDEEKSKRLIPFRRISVAAAVLFVIALGGYLFQQNQYKTTSKLADKAPEIIDSNRPLDLSLNKPEKQTKNKTIASAVKKKKVYEARVGSRKHDLPKINVSETERKNNDVAEVTLTGYGTKIDKQSYRGYTTTITAEQMTRRPTVDAARALEGSALGVQVTNGSGAPSSQSSVPVQGEQGRKIDKRAYVGSLTTVTAEQIAKRPVTNIAKAIEGSVPGVQVTSGGGRPGPASDILMRGSGSIDVQNSPLIVKNGVVFKGKLTDIAPSEVTSMSFLKDAAATALYGSRAANGVILITTKQRGFFGKIWTKIFKRNSPARTASMVKEIESSEDYEPYIENVFTNTQKEPLSTFSVDVDNASYSNIRRFINNGQNVPKDAVRIEEMINYFKYNYEPPTGNHPVALHSEYNIAPWNKQHKILKIGLQGAEIPMDKLPASNLVFLIDVSGSMDEANKLPLLKSSFKMLVAKLKSDDVVSIVVYAGAAGVVLQPTKGNEKEKIIAALDALDAGGSTAGGEGIELAYKLAQDNFKPGGNNRVILATDGDFNVGASSNEDMQQLIEQKRKSNIFLTCLGYGMGNYKDSKLELLADKGNGNYAYIDNAKEANRFLVKAFGGTMFTIARDVKIQVDFNPDYVASYRLIGYENRKLNAEDFANDEVDAGEIGSGHTVTALYEIIPVGVSSKFLPDDKRNSAKKNKGNDELAVVKFRYKKPTGNKSIELVEKIPLTNAGRSDASTDFKFSTAVAWFGLKLRDSKLVADQEWQHIIDWGKEATGKTEDEEKIEFLELLKEMEE